ncbi:protein of unknown function [uncultured Woeseiaceae bacterium]|uniref:Uncharacterized protein n=1 Tax=uncultured Woeseiaceae bacterium TaxID=1983305 RepID=A0A7D9H3V3_9GAMM|nr:protein of unknown function [uncultured Woeseiaceae bacterium]
MASWLNTIRILNRAEILIQRELLQKRWTLLLLKTELKWKRVL